MLNIYTFNKNNNINYKILALKKKKFKKLKTKYKYKIVVIKNKLFQIFLQNKKITSIMRQEHTYKIFENNFEKFDFDFEFFFDIIFRIKKQRFFFVLKSINLNQYIDKNFKKF